LHQPASARDRFQVTVTNLMKQEPAMDFSRTLAQ
jgi:hypothetical protein